MTQTSIILRRRSRIGRWLRIPSVFLAHFRINARHAVPLCDNLRVCACFSALLF